MTSQQFRYWEESEDSSENIPDIDALEIAEEMRKSIVRPAKPKNTVKSLCSLAALKIARIFSFDEMECAYNLSLENIDKYKPAENKSDDKCSSHDNEISYKSIPEELFQFIIKACFVEDVTELKFYSCLNNGNTDLFVRGRKLYAEKCVIDVYHIGFLLSGKVKAGRTSVAVSITIDRCRIVHSKCSLCTANKWCEHILAVCFYRIFSSDEVQYRTILRDSLSQMDNTDLKKLFLYFINELPQQHISLAQNFIDKLRDKKSNIAILAGAPDPTDGEHDEFASWAIDLSEISKKLGNLFEDIKSSERSGICDVEQFLMDNIPVITSEWLKILVSSFTKEPQGLWNLLEMIRLMISRWDINAFRILRIITEDYLYRPDYIGYWYQVILEQSGKWILSPQSIFNELRSKIDGRIPHYCVFGVYQKVIELWRMYALDPRLSDREREDLSDLMVEYQITFLRIVERELGGIRSNPFIVNANGYFVRDLDASYNMFPGFLTVYKTCRYAWDKVYAPLRNLICSNEDLTKGYAFKFKSICKEKTIWSRYQAISPLLKESVLSTIPQDPEGKDLSNKFFKSIDCSLTGEERSFLSRIDAHFYLIKGLDTFGYHEIALNRAICLSEVIIESLRTYIMGLMTNEITFNKDDRSKCDAIILQYRFHPAEMLKRSLYLFKMLIKYQNCRKISFDLAIFSLWFPRMASKSGFVEVKTYHYEAHFYKSLKNMKVTEDEVVVLRKIGVDFLKFIETLKDTEARVFPPMILANYLFAVLSGESVFLSDEINDKPENERDIRPCDDYLALKIACEMLNFDLTSRISEMFPMVCQRLTCYTMDFVYDLLIRYENDNDKLAIIIDRLLDPTVLKMFKFQSSNAAFFLYKSKIVGEHSNYSRPRFPSFHSSSLWEKCIKADYKCFCNHEVFQMKLIPDCKFSNPLSSPTENGIPLKKSGYDVPQDVLEDDFIIENDVNISMGRRLDSEVIRSRTLNCVKLILDSRVYSLMSLAKRVMRLPENSNNNLIGSPEGKNRAICAFLISLFALGISNQKNERWRARTFCDNASWITTLAQDLCIVGYQIIEQVWENILTPAETVSFILKDTRRKSTEESTACAYLAISVLRHSNNLSLVEFERLIDICSASGNEMLLKACFIAGAAGPLDPEIALCLVQNWQKIYDWQKSSSVNTSIDPELNNASPKSILQKNWDTIRETEIRWSISQCIKQHPYHTNVSPFLSSEFSTLMELPFSYTRQHLLNSTPSQIYQNFNMSYAKTSKNMLRESQSTPNLYNGLQHMPLLRMTPFYLVDNLPLVPSTSMHQGSLINPNSLAECPDRIVTTIVGNHPAIPTLPSSFVFDERVIPNSPTCIENIAKLALIQANVIGIKALMTIERRQGTLDTSFLANVQRSSFYLKDLRWLFDIAYEMGPLWAIEFCKVASTAILPPSTLYYLADYCIQLNLKVMPFNMEPLKLTMRTFILAGVGLLNVNCVTPDIRYFLYDGGWSFPVVDLLQGCLEMLYIDASSKLAHCRMCQSLIDEILCLIKTAKKICDRIPKHSKKVFDGFIRHIKQQKGCRTDLNKTINEFLEENVF